MLIFTKDQGGLDYRDYFCTTAELKSSYYRCRGLSVPAETQKFLKTVPKNCLDSHLADNILLIAVTERVITHHYFANPQKDHIYILCDPDLVALKIFAAPEVLTALEEMGIEPGTLFTEDSCGTNALALARERRRIRAIRGKQHYCKLFKDWWCVAGPVKGPGGKIAGYLDISLHAEKELVSTFEFFRLLIDSIEEKFSRLYLNQAGEKTHETIPLLPEVERELTGREREVMRLLLQRLRNKEIAREIGVSISTVRKHRQNIYQKLGVSSIDELLSRFNPGE